MHFKIIACHGVFMMQYSLLFHFNELKEIFVVESDFFQETKKKVYAIHLF